MINSDARAEELLQQRLVENARQVDRGFVALLFAQWVLAIVLALLISPRTWVGAEPSLHVHVLAAVFLGGGLTLFPVCLAWSRPGCVSTRHAIAVAQMLYSALLIHLTGGRIETHFHVFGSMAFLGFYRDWRVLLTATLVTLVDHVAGGLFWPLAVYGIETGAEWRWLEHAAWVVFENVILLRGIARLTALDRVACRDRAVLEALDESTVEELRDRSIGLIVAEFAMDGTLIACNQRFLAVTGYRMDEVVGRSHRLLVDDSEGAKTKYGAMWATLQLGEFVSSEFKWRGRDGHTLWCRGAYTPVRSDTGEVQSVVLHALDVTSDRLRALEVEGRLAAIDRSRMVVDYAVNGTILTANEQFLRTSGYSREELIGRHHKLLNAPGVVGSEELWERLARGEHVTTEFKRVGKGGREFWIHASYTPILDLEGRPDRIVEYAEDITAEKYRTADFEGQITAIDRSQLVVELSMDGTIVTANENYLKAAGYTIDEITGLHHRTLVHESEHESPEYLEFHETLRRGETVSAEFRRLGKSGNDFWLRAAYVPIPGLDGNPYKIVCYASNVTDRVKTTLVLDEVLREVNALRTALDEQMIMSITDRRGRIVDANTAFVQISGYTREELLGEDHRILNSGTHPKTFWRDVWRTIASGRAWRGEVCNRRKDGSLYWVDSTIVPYMGADGKVEKYVSIRFDITAQKAAEEALTISEDRFDRAITGSSDGLWDYEPATGRVWYSDRFRTLLGFGPEQFDDFSDRFDSWADRLHPRDRDAVLEEIELHLKHRTPFDVSHRLLTEQGGYRWFRARGQATWDDDGNPIRMAGSLRDTHEQRLAEERLDLAIRSAKQGLWDWNVQTGETYFNESFYTMLGYAPGELPMTVETWKTLSHPEDAPRARELLEWHLHGSAPEYRCEQRLRCKDGSWRWVLDVGRVVERSDSGEPLRMIGVHIDIDQQKEAAIRLELALSAANAGWWDWNVAEGSFTSNDEFHEMLGEAPVAERLPEQYFTGRIHDEDLPRFLRAVDRAYQEEGHRFDIEVRLRCHDGQYKWLRSYGLVVERTPDGAPLRMIGQHVDIDEWKRVAAERERLNAELVEMARKAGIAESATDVLHNVGNVLNSINVSASLTLETIRNSKSKRVGDVAELLVEHNGQLGEYLENDPKGVRVPGYLKSLGTALDAERDNVIGELKSLTSNVDHVKTIIAAQQSMASTSGFVEMCRPSDVLEQALRMQQSSLDKTGVFVESRYEDLPPLLLDRQKLMQILVNLIKNAREAVHEAPSERRRLDLEIRRVGEDRVAIEVRDHGVGIPDDILDRIFAHGFTTKSDGHGFGLHSCANFAKEMGGCLRVASEGVGTGATFTVELPLSTQPEQPKRATNPEREAVADVVESV